MTRETANPEAGAAGSTPVQKLLKPSAPRYQPNIVPLIDVLFMLLLFFLLSTHFRQLEGDIPGTVPREGILVRPGDPPTTRIEIAVRPVGPLRESCLYEVRGSPAPFNSPEELYQRLQAIQGVLKDGKIEIAIRPAGNVRWLHVVEAFNAAVRAKFKVVGFERAS
jgi:biopolymer transport protein ExbD